MSNINVSVEFDGISPRMELWHVYQIEKNGAKDILLSKTEGPTPPEGWAIVGYMGHMRAPGQ